MTSMDQADVAVVGSGAAGLAAAIALRQRGWDVQVLEQSAKPKARFCGEFLSGEALEPLRALGVATRLERHAPAIVRRTRLISPRRSVFAMPLGSGGWGLSRAALDGSLALYAEDFGVRVRVGTPVETIEGQPASGFVLRLGDARAIRARAIVAAWGKRSGLDRSLGRKFFAHATDWIGIRQKFVCPRFGDAVELHFLPGGYCGAVQVESGLVNICMLARQRWLAEASGDPAGVVRNVLRQTELGDSLAGAKEVADSLQSIAAVSFRSKDTLPTGVFGVGDAAGLVAPFLGAGVANALRGGVEAARFVDRGLRNDALAREHAAYADWWRKEFGVTQRWSRLASAGLSQGTVAEVGVRAMRLAPLVAERLYRSSRASRALGRGKLARGPL